MYRIIYLIIIPVFLGISTVLSSCDKKKEKKTVSFCLSMIFQVVHLFLTILYGSYVSMAIMPGGSISSMLKATRT